MRVAFIALVSFLSCSSAIFAESQRVQDVELCQLRQHASDFDHRMVRVRGTVDLGFENFTFFDPKCKDPQQIPVWLQLGGKTSDSDDGQSVQLQKDLAYEQFYKLIYSSRNRMPNGKLCYWLGCPFYRVSATLVGVFLAERDNQGVHIGYGHLGCCSLLVIQRVSDVSATRTSVPVGTLECRSSTWNPSAQDVPELNSYLQCESYCQVPGGALVSRVAAHWGDSVIVSSGITDGPFSDTSGQHPTDHFTWTSGDLLTSYAMFAKKTSPPEFFITRQICRPSEQMASVGQPISCDEYTTGDWGPERQKEYGHLLDKDEYVAAENMVVERAEQLSLGGDQKWRKESLSVAARAVINEKIELWGITADSNLKADKCTEPESLDNQQYGYARCSWYSPDGMQEFTVNLLVKKQGYSESHHSPWLLIGASARICHTDPSLTTVVLQSGG